MLNITWNKNISPEHKAEIESCLLPFLWFVPSWCAMLHINLFDQRDSGALADISVLYQYRRANINFYSTWLIEDERERLFTVLHELTHLHTGVIADYSRDTFDTLCPPNEADKFNRSIHAELQARHESATQDIALAIFNNLYKEQDAQI